MDGETTPSRAGNVRPLASEGASEVPSAPGHAYTDRGARIVVIRHA